MSNICSVTMPETVLLLQLASSIICIVKYCVNRIANFKNRIMKTITKTIAAVLMMLLFATAQAQPFANAGNDQTICAGSSVILGGTPTVSGGNPPYLYQWSPSFSLNNATLSNPTAMPASTTSYTVTVTDNSLATATATVTITVNQLPVVDSTIVTNVSCNGGNNGAVCVYISGGSLPYSYAWSNGSITSPCATGGLSAANYTVTVVDANACTITATATVSQPTQLQVDSIITTNASCNGATDGSVCFYTSGGSGIWQYSFIISNGGAISGSQPCFNNLYAGNGSGAVIDSNGCQVPLNFTITEPTQLTVTATPSNVSCNGGNDGSANAIPSGGTSSYTFEWSPASVLTQHLPGVPAGVYTVTVTDNNLCTASASVTITEPAALAANITNLGNGILPDTLQVNVTGGCPVYNYNWNTSATTQQIVAYVNSGYNLTITDCNNCNTTASIVISSSGLSVTVATTDALCNGMANGSAVITATGGTPSYTYSIDGGATFQGSNTFSNLSVGSYSVVVHDAAGGSATSGFAIYQPAAITASITNTGNGIMPDTLVAVVTGGGCGTYTYAWSNFSTGPQNIISSYGNYVFTVVDCNNCTASATINVNASGLSASAAATPVQCSYTTNGSAVITATGGSQPYSYSIDGGITFQPSNTFTNLSPGNYSVIVNDMLAASVTVSFDINQPAALSITGSSTNVLCNGDATGTINVSISNGFPSYTYDWSFPGNWGPQVTNLAAGTYGLTVTDAHNCTAAIGFTITQPTQFVIDSISITNVTCAFGSDGQACVHASGGTPYPSGSGIPTGTYIWSNAAIDSCIYGLTIGTYSITATDMNGCSVSTNFTVLQSNQSQCVYPGDADYNGLANNNDLLAIGLGYGTTGTARAQQDINWYGHFATDWADTLSTGTNYKHIDCNGDGTINSDDTLAIIQNYGLTHAKNNESKPWRATDPALYVELVPDTTHAGDTMYAYLTLGDVNIPANNVYGIAFTLNYDINVVDSNKTKAVFGSSWLGNATDKISIAKDLKQGELKCALTRIDHTTRSGNGQIGVATFVITTDNINGKNFAYYNMHVWLSDVTMIDNLGNVIQVNEGQDSTNVEFEPTGIAELGLRNADLKIQPNPANDVVQISVTEELIGVELKLLDIEGRTLTTTTISTSSFKLQTSNWLNGIYLVQISNERGTLTKRLVIAR